ncbi:hypothetical protein L0Y69_02530 [bacterium]|nr:hypothetical protein [bacterium]
MERRILENWPQYDEACLLDEHPFNSVLDEARTRAASAVPSLALIGCGLVIALLDMELLLERMLIQQETLPITLRDFSLEFDLRVVRLVQKLVV